MTVNSETALRGTPYLTQGDANAEERFQKVRARAVEVKGRASRTYERISREAATMLEPYTAAILSEQVAESNRIEGYDWTASDVRELVEVHKELLVAPVGSFMAALRNDERVYQALGLYRAHELAELWAQSDRRPREFEVRALHELITAGEIFAGKYKTTSNQIGGTSHKTADPWDVPRVMDELCTWWGNTPEDPALAATVVHAWLTHIHPFDDGNGRLARVLTNLTLIQAGYPPFLIRSEADRGQYYDALSASDDGDILPLYDLVVRVLRRTIGTMANPNYVRDMIENKLLTSDQERYNIWLSLAKSFTSALGTHLNGYHWSVEEQGYPDLWSFSLLTQRNLDGNCWYLKVRDEYGRSKWLLWFGFASDDLGYLLNRTTHYPSIFISTRDEDPTFVHPYRRVSSRESGLPDEISLAPLERGGPVTLLCEYSTQNLDLNTAAGRVASGLAAA